VQYVLGETDVRGDTQLGATRAGGFLQARLGDPARYVPSVGSHGPVLVSKVTVGAPEDVTSAHLQLEGSTFTAQDIAWGNGNNGTGAGPTVELECTSCHNPHGNGQYRILNPLPSLTASVGTFVDPISYSIAAVDGTGDYIETTVGHQFQPGDFVTVNGTTGVANGEYRVVALVSGSGGIRFQINTLASWPTTTAMDLTDAGAGGTVKRTEAPVADVPLGVIDPTTGYYQEKNYTVIQTKGTQGDDSTYLLYAQDVIDAGYGPTDGDYWRRYVPWNSNTGNKDAPNGKPDTLVDAPKNITAIASNVITVASHGYLVGDVVEILGAGDDGQYTVATVPSSSTFTVTGGTFTDGTWSSAWPTAQRVSGAAHGDIAFNQQMTAWCATCHSRYFAYQNPKLSDPTTTGAAYANPRVGDELFKYQHSTRDNRVCTTCHVVHGSNAVMNGDYSSTLPYPGDTTPSADSRLLKVDNRGTCTLCHDPTETVEVGTYTGPEATPGVP
jgi:hypothetical protein